MTRVPEDERATYTFDEWATMFSLLGDPNRLRLVMRIHSEGRVNVTDLADHADMSMTAVSHALRVLRNSGAVTAEREGQRMYYSLASPLVRELMRLDAGRA
jgi:DNA-binding transcriptional ArsR family regulator